LRILVLLMISLLYAAFIGRSAMLVIYQGINPFALGKGKTGFNRFLELFFFAGLLYWTFELVNTAMGFKWVILPNVFYVKLFENIFLQGLGCLMLIAGWVLFLWALFSFGASWRIGIDSYSPGKLVTSGIFTISRNPIFVAVDLYGENYGQYLKKVRRYL